MTRSLTIPIDGPPERSDQEPDAVARALLHTSSLDVVVARALGNIDVHVMYVDDWGMTKNLPINRRAWALYGGSPIYGPAVLASDVGDPLDDELIAMISSDDFPPLNVQAAMDQWLAAHP